MLSKNLIAASGNAGGESYWWGKYASPNYEHFAIYKTVFDSNGDMIIRGNASGGTNILIKASKDGEIIWKRRLTGTTLNDIVIDSNDNIIFTGSSGVYALITKMNTNGSVIFAKRITDSSSAIYSSFAGSVTVDSNDNIIFTGRYNYDFGGGFYAEKPFIVKLSSTGVPVWQRATFDYDSAFAVKTDSQDNVIFCVVRYDRSDMILIKLNSNGGAVWRNYYDGGGSSQRVRASGLVVGSDDSLYVQSSHNNNGRAHMGIFKILSNGNFSHYSRVDLPNSANNNPRGIAIDSEDNLYIGDMWRGFYKFNSSGTILYRADIDFTNNHYTQNIAIDPDDNVIIVGYVNDNTNDQEGFIVKVPNDNSALGAFGDLTISSEPFNTITMSFSKNTESSPSTEYTSISSNTVGTQNITLNEIITDIEV